MMQVLVIRHAIAADRVAWARDGRPDEERPLSPKGVRRWRRGAAGVRRCVPHLALIATSPLVRAVQTAELLREAYAGEPPLRETKTLLPDADPEDLAHWLAEAGGTGPVAAVGHEPHLSAWMSWALTGERISFIEFKKGAAALLEFPARPAAAEAVLQWVVTPRYLRRLGARA